jgi:hypothetical protein
MDENAETVAVDPVAMTDEAEAPVDLWDLLKSEMSDEAHQVAQDLAEDFPPLMHKLVEAAEHEVPAVMGAILRHPFMQHLEAQLPTATLGIVHGLLGLVL